MTTISMWMPWETQDFPALALRRSIARPPAEAERTSFAYVAGSSGELPLVAGDPALTAKIFAPVTYGRRAEQPRPRRYRGARRLDRSRAALNAACALRGGAR